MSYRIARVIVRISSYEFQVRISHPSHEQQHRHTTLLPESPALATDWPSAQTPQGGGAVTPWLRQLLAGRADCTVVFGQKFVISAAPVISILVDDGGGGSVGAR